MGCSGGPQPAPLPCALSCPEQALHPCQGEEKSLTWVGSHPAPPGGSVAKGAAIPRAGDLIGGPPTQTRSAQQPFISKGRVDCV